MNIFIRYCFLVVLALLLEVIVPGETYKRIRPYKYYQRRPWRSPRWYTSHKSSKFYHSKRIPPEDHYFHRPGYYRYHPTSEDFDRHVESKPYTIVIQLPKGDNKYSHNDYLDRKRNYEKDSMPVFTNESDYIDEEEDYESKVINVNDKKVQIKMVKGENPKLHIKISRSDVDNDIKIIDKTNITAEDLSLSTRAHANLTLSTRQSTVMGTTDASTFFPEDI